MNAEQFVKGVFRRMISCMQEEFTLIASPAPGRKPVHPLAEIHRWYAQLPDTDKAMVKQTIQRTHEGAIYSLLMVLDHKAFVEGPGEKGELELFYRAPTGERTHLNPFGGEDGKDLEYYFKTLRDRYQANEL